jgi:hypothetical protein
VHSRHQSFLNAKTFLEENVNDRRKTVCRAGRVRNDRVFGQVQFVVVHTHDDRDVFALRGCGNDDLFGTGSDVALGFFRLGEQTGRFDYQLDAQCAPWQFRRCLG